MPLEYLNISKEPNKFQTKNKKIATINNNQLFLQHG